MFARKQNVSICVACLRLAHTAGAKWPATGYPRCSPQGASSGPHHGGGPAIPLSRARDDEPDSSLGLVGFRSGRVQEFQGGSNVFRKTNRRIPFRSWAQPAKGTSSLVTVNPHTATEDSHPRPRRSVRHKNHARTSAGHGTPVRCNDPGVSWMGS